MRKKKLTDSEETESEEETETTEEESTEEVTTTATSTTSSSKECQYIKTTNGYWNYGSWSSWQTTKVSSSSTREVQTKTEKVKTGTTVVQSGTTKVTQNPKKVTTTKNGTTTVYYVCPSDFDNGGTYTSAVTCVKTSPKYETKNTYKDVTYYRYRDKSYVKSTTTYTWSSCNNSSLIDSGYKATGKTR